MGQYPEAIYILLGQFGHTNTFPVPAAIMVLIKHRNGMKKAFFGKPHFILTVPAGIKRTVSLDVPGEKPNKNLSDLATVC